MIYDLISVVVISASPAGLLIHSTDARLFCTISKKNWVSTGNFILKLEMTPF